MSSLQSLSKKIPFVVLLLSWLLPNHVPPFSAAYQDFLAFSVIMAFIAFFPVVIGTGFSFFVLLFFCFVPILQFFFGVIYFWGDAFLAAAYLFFFWLAFSFSSGFSGGFLTREEFVSNFFFFLILASVLSVWIAARQWLSLPGSLWVVDMPPNGRPFANIAQPNNLATLLSMGFLGVFYFYERKYFGCVVFWLLVIFLLFGIALTQSRTPWVVFPGMLLYWVLKWRQDFRLTKFAFVGVVAVYAGLVVLLPLLSGALLLSTASPYERIQSLERLDLWWQLLHAVVNGPLWGYGWNQVSVAQVYISQAYPVALMTEHSHNIVLDLLLWNGPVLGGVIVLFLGGWLAKILWRSRSIESLCSIMAACAVIIHGMLEFPLEYAFLLVPVALLLGVAVAEDRTVKTIHVRPLFRYGVACVLAVSLILSWKEYCSVEEDYRLMRFETANIGSVQPHRLVPSVKLFTQLKEFVWFARTPAVEGMSEQELERMRKVAHRYPYPPSLFRYSLALGLNGHAHEASKQLAILRALHGDDDYLEALRSMESLKSRYPQLLEIPADIASSISRND